MATISGSSADNWSSVSFPALDLDGDLGILAGRVSTILLAFTGRDFDVNSASSSRIQVHLNHPDALGSLVVNGSNFNSSPKIKSGVFTADSSQELVRIAGKLDADGGRITSLTYQPPSGSHKLIAKGNFVIDPFDRTLNGTLSSIILEADGTSIAFVGNATISDTEFGPLAINGNIRTITISGPDGKATFSGLSVPYSAVEGIDSPADLFVALAPFLGGNDNISFNSGTGIALHSGAGNDTLRGGNAEDTLAGGTGNDVYILTSAAVQDVVTEVAGEGTDTLRLLFNVVADTPIDLEDFPEVENAEALGTGAFHLFGNDLDNALTGNASGNSLGGGAGDDTLDGKGGVDTLAGGEGNDLLVLDHALDQVVEAADEGADTVRIAYSVKGATTIDLSSQYDGNVEHVQVTGAGAFSLLGNAAANSLTGNASANVLDGKAGDDTLAGNGGNDSYFVDSENDVIIEAAKGGTDTVTSTATSYALSANVEKLVLAGAGGQTGIGNALANHITGTAGADTLEGGPGNDTLAGGLGADTYRVGIGNDRIVETGDDVDLVESTSTFSIASLLLIENLKLTGTANINATGNAGDNVLTGNDGDNLLDGGAGSNTLRGGLGNDTYVVRSLDSDQVEEDEDQGSDTVRLLFNTAAPDTIDLTVDFENIENVEALGTGAFHLVGSDADNRLVGNASGNSLTGGAGNDTLDGKGGVDTLNGGAGNDVYVIDRLLDVVEEESGNDTLQLAFNVSRATIIDLNLLFGAALENAEAVGKGVFHIIGTDGDNVLTGNASGNGLTGGGGNDTLDGRGGVDTLVGGAGDDLLVLDRASDVVDETGGGNDTVRLAFNVSKATNIDLQARYGGNIEHAEVAGNGRFNLLGNAANNALTGNAAANVLDGRGGADTMTGFAGNDAYFVDDVGDVVVDSEGTADVLTADADAILASAGGTAPVIAMDTAWAGVEHVTITGTAALGVIGTAAANRLTGNAGDNTLDGGGGNDTLVGGLGNDRYVIDSAGDVITEAANGGIDTVVSSLATYVLGATLENLELAPGAAHLQGTGNAGNNVLIGNDGNNLLDGGAGADTMMGGGGNDVFIVDNVGDVATDSDGFDIVIASVSYSLGDGIETLSMNTGAVAVGNALDNMITANSADNTLDGGAGADTLVGGFGNDRYIVDVAEDVIEDELGFDSVLSSAPTYTLAAGLENLELAAGDADLHGTGNDSANVITGNDGHNSLSGGGGNDTLIGGAGNDTLNAGRGADSLVGGDGDDLYILDEGVPPAGIRIELAGTGFVLNGERTLTSGPSGPPIVTVFDADNDGGADMLNVSLSNWHLSFTTRYVPGNFLQGHYDDATNAAQPTGRPTLDVSGEGRAWGLEVTGEFTVHVADFNFSAGLVTVNMFSITFEQHNSLGDPILWGTLTINNTGEPLADQIVELADGGIDTVQTEHSYSLGANLENLVLTGTADIDGSGNELDNQITGNAGNNRLQGHGGADTLTGGGGADAFVFSEAPATGIDTITDFFTADDRIELDNAVFTALEFGALAAGAFASGDGLTSAADADHRIIYDTETGDLYYDADGVGGVDAVKFATLTGAPALAASDFEVV